MIIQVENSFFLSKANLLSIYIKMGVQMFVCQSVCLSVSLSVGMWRAYGNPNLCTDIDEILHAQKEGFGAGLTLAASPLGLGET